MNDNLNSAVYEGRVMHCRLKPRQHRFAYRVFWLLLDLDEIDTIGGSLKLFSRNRFNLFSFHDTDYGAGEERTLRGHVEGHLLSTGIDCRGGRITLFSMPRILGYAFNPLAIYFCHRPAGDLAAILYEVNNTFGERHSYLIPVEGICDRAIRQECIKEFYVSPFMDMAMRYVFRVAPPNDRIRVTIIGLDSEGPIITAALTADRRKLTDAALVAAFFRFPFLTLKVIIAIHIEAARLWLKGYRPFTRPTAPLHAVSAIRMRRHSKTGREDARSAQA
jgi:hypothetical protein